MKLSDLKTGMIVETRDGETGLIVKDNCYGEDAVIFSNDSWTPLIGFNKDLSWSSVSFFPDSDSYSDFYKSLDIVKVFQPSLPTGFLSKDSKGNNEMVPLWKREEEKEVKQYTMKQLQKKLGHEFKIKK